MAISINGIAVPQAIRERGSYVYYAGVEMVQNGLGETKSAGLPYVEWRFNSLSQPNYTWWVTTLLGGALSKRCPAVLWNDLDVEVSYSGVTVRRPTYQRRANNRYYDVTVRIDTMVI